MAIVGLQAGAKEKGNRDEQKNSPREEAVNEASVQISVPSYVEVTQLKRRVR
jgi:hypothetical protein